MNKITEKDKEFVLNIEQEVNSCINPSLQQPKMPVMFKCEMEKERGVEVEITDKMGETRKVTIPYNGSVYVFNDFKTTINSQGHTQWIGEYIY